VTAFDLSRRAVGLMRQHELYRRTRRACVFEHNALDGGVAAAVASAHAGFLLEEQRLRQADTRREDLPRASDLLQDALHEDLLPGSVRRACDDAVMGSSAGDGRTAFAYSSVGSSLVDGSVDARAGQGRNAVTAVWCDDAGGAADLGNAASLLASIEQWRGLDKGTIDVPCKEEAAPPTADRGVAVHSGWCAAAPLPPLPCPLPQPASPGSGRVGGCLYRYRGFDLALMLFMASALPSVRGMVATAAAAWLLLGRSVVLVNAYLHRSSFL
jgi:hypothetical protein